MFKKVLLGFFLGFAAGMVLNYLFGPAEETAYDHTYRSRWDKALDDGAQAADDRESELLEQLQATKRVSI